MKNLTLIGETINYSIPRTGRLLDAGDYDAVAEIARSQAERGADYIDVNVGPLSPDVMGEVVRAVREAVSVPVCIDSTDPDMLAAGLEACAAGGADDAPGPIVNSALEHNADRVFGLKARFDCQVVLLVSERLQDGALRRNSAAAQAADTARRLFERARGAGFAPGEIYIDPGTPPIGSDLDGIVNTALETVGRISSDTEMGKAHILVGISNFTAGLPKDVRLPLQNAFLTMAMAGGLDTLIGDPRKEYRLLEPGDPHLAWLERILSASGAKRLEELATCSFYRSASAADDSGKQQHGRKQGDTR